MRHRPRSAVSHANPSLSAYFLAAVASSAGLAYPAFAIFRSPLSPSDDRHAMHVAASVTALHATSSSLQLFAILLQTSSSLPVSLRSALRSSVTSSCFFSSNRLAADTAECSICTSRSLQAALRTILNSSAACSSPAPFCVFRPPRRLRLPFCK